MKKEVKELAAQLAAEVLEGFSSYTKQVCALLGSVRAFEMVFIPEIEAATGILFKTEPSGKPEIKTGMDPLQISERRNLGKLLGGDSYLDTLNIVDGYSSSGKSREIRQGDYVEISAQVPEITINGVEFEEVNLEKAELTVVHVTDKHVFFNFEDIVLQCAMNQKDTNKGGFKETALKEYLNGCFFERVFPGMEVVFQETKDGHYISIPTKHEVFGIGEDDDFNWPELCSEQFEYYRKYKNRIKIKDDDTAWWWLATPSTGNATNFCYVDFGGSDTSGSASNYDGGSAPLLCI